MRRFAGRKRRPVVAALLLLGGVMVVGFSLETHRHAGESPGWPTVKGEVVSSRVAGMGGGRAGGGYRAELEYQYRVDGKHYTGRRVSFGRARGDRSQAHAEVIVDRYPAGAAVTVHYRPDRPAVSVLEPGGRAPPLVPLLLSSLFFIGAILNWRHGSADRGP